MSKRQSFNPIPLVLIGVCSGSFAVISVFFINWKGTVIEETNSPQQPVQITLPTTPITTDQPVEKVEEIKSQPIKLPYSYQSMSRFYLMQCNKSHPLGIVGNREGVETAC